MEVKNLSFFGTDGYNLNFEWNKDSSCWEGTIYLPKVSVGLYANTNIYVMENINDDYYFPQVGGDNKIMFRWDLANNFVDEFFMFTFDESYYNRLPIDTSSLIYTPNDGPELETLIVNKFDTYEIELDNTMSQKVLPIHVAFSSPEKYDGTTFKRTLNMFYDDTNIAKITFYAETVEEDERLNILNRNLGYKITPGDTIIFKDSDIKECYPDYQMLNEKRKELLIEGHNIYPYIGSYKAIINIIKFFGYENLNIIEFWRNVDSTSDNFGKLFATTKYSLTEKETISVKGKTIPIPNKNYRKANNIALVYTINHPLPDVDELELPLVKEDFTYTIEEAIIKLFALRRKLNSDFMPSSSRIVDIIGEATYFGLQEISNNAVVPQNKINYHTKRHHWGSINTYPSKFIHLTDCRPFQQFAIEQKSYDSEDSAYEKYVINKETPIDSISDKKIDEIGNIEDSIYNEIPDVGESSKVTYYERYWERVHDDCVLVDTYEPSENKNVEHKATAKVILENTSFDEVLFSNIPNKFGYIETKNMTFGNIDTKYYGYENIRWTISFSKNQKDDEFDNIGIEKEYDNKVFNDIIIDGDINEYKKVFVELPYVGYYDVKMKFYNGTQINNFTKYFDNEDTSSLTKQNYVYDKDFDGDKKDDDIEIEYTFKKAIKVEPYTLDIRGFYYDARELPKHLKYDPESIGITLTDSSEEEVIINEYTEFIERKITDMTNGARFERADEKNVDKSLPIYTPDGSIVNPGPYKQSVINRSWYLLDNLNYDITSLKPNVRDARYIKNGVDVKPYTWFLLGFDETKITGIKNPHWVFTNIGTKEYVEHDGSYFTLLLREEGDYKIELTLEDTNDNKYSVSRNIIVVSEDANYKLYHRFKEDYDAYKSEKDARLSKLYQDFARLDASSNIDE